MSAVSGERKALYYLGMGMIAVGFLLFISVFFSGARSFGDPFAPMSPPPVGNAVFGMVLMIAGGALMNVGAKGAAGSGLILDPKKAVEDLKPFNEAKGEMINDIVNNIDFAKNLGNTREVREVIKIRCKTCDTVNDEDAKFCKNCGNEI